MDKIDFEELNKLLTRFDKSGLSTITVERSAKGDYKISIQKEKTAVQPPVMVPMHTANPAISETHPHYPHNTGHGGFQNSKDSLPQAQQSAHSTSHQEQSPSVAKDQGATSTSATDHETLTSPIVGTFYRAPNPDSPPFVQIGDTVRKGECLCILEAMKVLNEFEAEFDMEIIDVLSENQKLVEYGQALFKVKRL